jgi:hypothetical protein
VQERALLVQPLQFAGQALDLAFQRGEPPLGEESLRPPSSRAAMARPTCESRITATSGIISATRRTIRKSIIPG